MIVYFVSRPSTTFTTFCTVILVAINALPLVVVIVFILPVPILTSLSIAVLLVHACGVYCIVLFLFSRLVISLHAHFYVLGPFPLSCSLSSFVSNAPPSAPFDLVCASSTNLVRLSWSRITSTDCPRRSSHRLSLPSSILSNASFSAQAYPNFIAYPSSPAQTSLFFWVFGLLVSFLFHCSWLSAPPPFFLRSVVQSSVCMISCFTSHLADAASALHPCAI